MECDSQLVKKFQEGSHKVWARYGSTPSSPDTVQISFVLFNIGAVIFRRPEHLICLPDFKRWL
jgi:hypothetical protein